MKIVDFPERNAVIAEFQEEYLPLPVYKLETAIVEEMQKGVTTACYKLTIRERIKLLFTGKVWVNIWTFRKPFPPIYMTIDKAEVIPASATADALLLPDYADRAKYPEYKRTKATLYKMAELQEKQRLREQYLAEGYTQGEPLERRVAMEYDAIPKETREARAEQLVSAWERVNK